MNSTRDNRQLHDTSTHLKGLYQSGINAESNVDLEVLVISKKITDMDHNFERHLFTLPWDGAYQQRGRAQSVSGGYGTQDKAGISQFQEREADKLLNILEATLPTPHSKIIISLQVFLIMTEEIKEMIKRISDDVHPRYIRVYNMNNQDDELDPDCLSLSTHS